MCRNNEHDDGDSNGQRHVDDESLKQAGLQLTCVLLPQLQAPRGLNAERMPVQGRRCHMCMCISVSDCLDCWMARAKRWPIKSHRRSRRRLLVAKACAFTSIGRQIDCHCSANTALTRQYIGEPVKFSGSRSISISSFRRASGTYSLLLPSYRLDPIKTSRQTQPLADRSASCSQLLAVNFH